MLLCVASIRACISFTWGKNEGVTPGSRGGFPTNELVFVERLSVVFCSDPALNYVSGPDRVHAAAPGPLIHYTPVFAV